VVPCSSKARFLVWISLSRASSVDNDVTAGIAEADPLTGARTRAPGLADLDHEIDRARRTTDLLAVAHADIVGHTAENDNHGHAAGDALLQRAVRAIRAHLRSCDMIVRIGGDEFL
jgi:diguanylate cyclase (GGDEF)-like protein